MSRMSETPKGVMETYDWQDVAEDLQERIDKAIEYINSNPTVFYDEYLVDVETLLNNETEENHFISSLLKILKGE